MLSGGNVLILKGDLPADDVLCVLDTLIQEVARHTRSRPPPQPYELFSCICASGVSSPLAILLGRLRKSLTECRQIMKIIEANNNRLGRLPSPWNAWSALSNVKSSLADTCGDTLFAQSSLDPGNRCCVMIWKPRAAVEAPDHLMSHVCSNKDGVPATDSMSAVDALTTSLSMREEVVQQGASTESPFHGLVNEVVTWQDMHNARVCISIRSPPKDLNEAISEQWAEDRLLGKGDPSSKMKNVRHFGFVIDPSDLSKHLATQILDDAARNLAGKPTQCTSSGTSDVTSRMLDKGLQGHYHGQYADGMYSDPYTGVSPL